MQADWEAEEEEDIALLSKQIKVMRVQESEGEAMCAE